MKKLNLLIVGAMLFCCVIYSQKSKNNTKKTPFVLAASNVYFIVTDRFNNGDKTNDFNYNRNKPTGELRGFNGGDIRGIIQKVEDNYFTNLGVNVIWMTPIVEQVHDGVDEGTGFTYGFHGYWTRDWSSLDPNFGTKAALHELVQKAHAKGIKIMLDAVINHTGPVTAEDSVYPNDWVRTFPKCSYNSYDTYIKCTLVENLPDILTESNEIVDLPSFLINKWKKEGRYEKEVAALDVFFKQTGFPRAPKYYIMKWLSDYISDFGIDGYRIDTVKHTEEAVWADFRKVCDMKFAEFKKKNPKKVMDNSPFFMIGEVYGYTIGSKKIYDFGDKKVDYFKHGFSALINFDFRNEAKMDYEELFSKYNHILQNDLKDYTVMNYVSSHDDSYPFDKNRENTIESGTKLLLSPGISQIYYGDESARSLNIKNTQGDATLRSDMNWQEILNNATTKENLLHWQKLGVFRKNHPSIGAGVHTQISNTPYVFSRTYQNLKYVDKVVIGLNLPKGEKSIPIGTIFTNGAKLKDAYSGKTTTVVKNVVTLTTDFDIVLLEKL